MKVAAVPAPRLTLVVDQLPFPPRNGVTLPLFHYLQQLRATHELSLCLLQDAAAPADAAWWADNEQRYGRITRIPLQQRSRARRVVAELGAAEMFQHGWRATHQDTLSAAAFTQVLVSPMSAVAKWRAVRRANPALVSRTMVAAVHDCTTAEYRWRLRSAHTGVAARAKAWLDLLRVPLIGRVEAALLSEYDSVLVQTAADHEAMRSLVGETTAQRCQLAPNGVRNDLFELHPAREERVLLVAELSGEYAAITEWLCTHVWPLVHAARPQARLRVVGRGASPRLRSVLERTAGVEALDFAPELADCYAVAGVVWSPVFKGFGLINKTLEGMASALPVVGGRAAFNGVKGFAEGQHGFGLDAPDAAAFAAATRRLLESPALRARVGESARQLIHGQFSWERSADVLRQAFALPAAAQSPPADVAAEPARADRG